MHCTFHNILHTCAQCRSEAIKIEGGEILIFPTENCLIFPSEKISADHFLISTIATPITLVCAREARAAKFWIKFFKKLKQWQNLSKFSSKMSILND